MPIIMIFMTVVKGVFLSLTSTGQSDILQYILIVKEFNYGKTKNSKQTLRQ